MLKLRHFITLLLITLLISCDTLELRWDLPKIPVDTSIPTDGLVAYYPFNGNANDESGNGNDGTVQGPTLTFDRFGRTNSAYLFDGINDFIDIGANVKPSFPVSVSCWIKVNKYSQHGGGIFRNDQVNDASYRYGLMLVTGLGGYIASHVFQGFSASWNRRTTSSEPGVITLGIWYNFTAIFHSHSEMELFLNGIKLTTTSEGSGSRMQYSKSNGGIGDSSGRNFFNGILDDIRIYKRALSEEEIRSLYHENGWDQ